MIGARATDLETAGDGAKARLKRYCLSPFFVFALLTAVLASCYFKPVRYLRSRSAEMWIEYAEKSARNTLSEPGLFYAQNYICLDGFVDFANGRGRCIPLALLRPDGDVKPGWLNLPIHVCHLKDEIWADPATGRFERIIQQDETPLFAQAFDGRHLYTCNPASPNGMRKEAMAKPFKMPEDRAKLSSIVAGFPVSFQIMRQKRPDYLGEAEVCGSGRARIFELTLPGPEGLMESKWQLKLRKSDRAITEVVCQLGRTQVCSITRLRTGSPPKSPLKWDLSEINHNF